MGCTACTEPQCLYKGALYFTVELYLYSPYGPYGLYKGALLLSIFIVDLGEILYKGSARYVARFVKIAQGRPYFSYVIK